MTFKTKTALGWLAACCIFVATGFAAAFGLPGDAKAAAGNAEEFKQLLERKVPQWQETYNVPGVAVGIIHNGQAGYTLNFGEADKKSHEPVSKDTLFQAGSISKSVTAWGILHLVDTGRISLDDPAAKYLTRWKLPDSPYDGSKVTLRQLLSHTAGLPAHKGYLGSAPGEPLPTLEESLSGAGWFGEPLQLAATPAQEAVYSGAGYTLLQLIIEEVTGLPFEKYMDQQVLKPLGMNASTFGAASDNPLMSTSYGYFGQALPDYQFTEKAAAGLSTTAADLMTLILASMEGNSENVQASTFLSKSLLQEMQIPVLSENGLGIFARTLPNDQIMLYHPGDNRGFHAFYGFVPETGDGLVILTNSENGIDLRQDIYYAWVQSLTDSVPDGLSAMNAARKTNAGIAIGLGAALGLYLLIFAIRLLKGRRRFITKHSRQPFVRLGIRVILLAATGTLLFLASWSWSILGLQSGLKNIVLWLFAWQAALLITGLFPKLKAPRKRSSAPPVPVSGKSV
ncbi:beta-lactamase family protein [Paenibacillus albidus]|uniref:serine hydrolase domain-containing protein n=1 Tax=Paenibacillus albidus TaxID=2041023 RepID=UPI001BE534B4|nr:serine hydrolase domain-containing protein [Paenibacillus albidus]MBT2293105.1 beta-lactamase family protein [Paenibacillus albidus]